MLESALIAHGAPTLARLKVGSAFAVPAGEGLCAEIGRLNGELEPKGVRLTALRVRDGRALMYLYRETELAAALSQVDVRAFLRSMGYAVFETVAVLERLRLRLAQSEEFPHEIGVFLGYPLPDVIAYIRNGGRNCLCCGCWKVYFDEHGARRTFARFRKCREVYARLFAQGCPLSKLTVRTRAA